MLEIKVGEEVSRYYYTHEIAEILELSLKTVTRYIRIGKIKAQKNGKSWIINENDLKEYLTKSASTSVK